MPANVSTTVTFFKHVCFLEKYLKRGHLLGCGAVCCDVLLNRVKLKIAPVLSFCQVA